MFCLAKAKSSSERPSESALDISLDTSEFIFSTLAEASKLTPVPYLQDAAGLALNIVTIIQGVRGNKKAFQRLANDACALVYIILCSDDNAIKAALLTPAYLDHARELVETLHEIYSYTKSQTSRNILIQFIRYKSDAGTIQEYRDRLKQSLDVFGVRSSMSIQHALASIQEQLAHMARQSTELSDSAAPRQDGPRIMAPSREVDRKQVGEDPETAQSLHSTPPSFRSPSSGQSPVSPHIQSAPSDFHAAIPALNGSFVSVGGAQNSYSGSVVNTNSGNTSTHVVSNSNNDSSVRIQRGKARRR